MRWILALIALGGCREILGIEDVELLPMPPPEDAPTSPDGLHDAPFGDAFFGCPADYATAGGSDLHRYKPHGVNRSWVQARDVCAAEGGYLAIPDTPAELQSLEQLVGPTRTWIGIDDVAVEGTYRNTFGMLQVFLPWAAGEPNGNAQDCVYLDSGNLADGGCGEQHPSVCECNP